MEKVSIVVAWVVEQMVHDGRPFARDLGQRPGMRAERVGVACMWLNAGTEEDVKKARAYCADASSRVGSDPDAPRHTFVYPTREQADFFIEVGKIAAQWPTPASNQWIDVGRHLRTCECSTPEARDMVEHLHSALTGEP